MTSIILKVLLIAFFLACCIGYSENKFVCSGAGIFNKICQVKFNQSKCHYDNYEKAKLDRAFQTCFNKTIKDENENRKNLSRELTSCQIKCVHEFHGHVNSDGKLNLEIIEKSIKQEHKMYSNATIDFVQKVVGFVTQCAKRAEYIVEKQSAGLDNCWKHGYLESCYNDKIMEILKNGNATVELCAAQGTKVKAIGLKGGVFKRYSSTATPYKGQ